MGHTKKRGCMKINEQLVLMTNQTSQKNQQEQLNFEQWLNTPTKKNSGDEYYWQHQDQLEQSSLHFDPQPLVNQEHKHEVIIRPNLIESTPSPMPTTSIPIQQNHFSYQPEKNNNTLLISEQLTQIFVDLKQELDQILTPDGSTNAPLKSIMAPRTEEIKATDVQQCNHHQFKNHHLFIEEEQVELTLNTKDLNPKEQRELTKMMKHHFKNKGLTLSKLIINGVHND